MTAAMDAVDIRILRAMGVMPYGPEPRPAPFMATRIARAAGVSPETVRQRVARMETSGVIMSYEVYPNLRHMGREGAGLLLTVQDEERRQALPGLMETIDELLTVHYFMGPQLCVEVCYTSQASWQRKVGLLSRLCNDQAPVPFISRAMPPVGKPLSSLDWQILAALRGRANRPLAEVAEEVGASYRTVKRHVDRMAAQGSFFAVPTINPGADGGLLPAALLFYLDEPQADCMRTILESFQDVYLGAGPPASSSLGNLDLLVFAPSPQGVEELRQRGAEMPGVKRVEALVYRGMSEHSDWIDDAIADRIAATATR